MDVTAITLDKEEAKVKYKEYLEAVKVHKSKEYNAVRRAYRALSKGYKVIDIYKAFEDTGVNDKEQPKLAIARADATKIYFLKENDGAGKFQMADPHDWRQKKYADYVKLPESTFPNWQREYPNPNRTWTKIKQRELVTNVPIIPAHVTVPGKIENYYVLFEVESWSIHAKTQDPYLLQRLNDNTFIVLAEWDVSEVEAIVMRGINPVA